ncbi:hypothetical protein [uncultured Thiodictyon sp.]|uniref:hypothetical protein n=1 Tax=uncultured Thiodictyon sp. TaxID=1846217 RepID=UPI0025E586DB|nr:hypothetical protein [uncultured Thiodictyon sp.]
MHGKLTADPAGHGVSVEKIAALGALNADFRARSAAVADITATAKRVTADKDQTEDALIALGREIARTIKARPGYTEGEGKELGIVGHQARFDPATAKPSLSGTDRTGEKLELRFVKGPTAGVNVYCQREGENGWVPVGRANHSPFIDTRPLLQPGKAELRRYTAIYVIHDQEIGQFSDTLEITCAP